MPLFYTDKQAKEEIASLKSHIESLELDHTSALGQIESLTTENKDLSEKVATLTTERDEVKQHLEASQNDLTTANEQLTEAQEKLATFDAEVEKSAQAKFESLGGNPIPASSSHDPEGSPAREVTRERFNRMTPREKSEFSKSGGKIK